MGLITQRSEGGSKIPPGEKLRFGILSAVEEWGQHGPQAEMILKALSGEYKGETLRDWSKLAQPRLDFVRALRGKEYSDEKIADILRAEGYEFEEIEDSEDELKVADGGKLFNICMAAFRGDTDAINSYETINDLLGSLVGRSFVSITKSRGTDGKYTGITWDQIYVDTEASEPDPEDDIDDIPY